MSVVRIFIVFLLGMMMACSGQGTRQAPLEPPDNWQVKRATDKKISYLVRSSTNAADEIARVEFERERPGDRDYRQGFELGLQGYLELIRRLAHESIDVKKESSEGAMLKGIVTSQKDQLRFEYRILAARDIMLTGHLSASQDHIADVHPTFDELFERISGSPWNEWPGK